MALLLAITIGKGKKLLHDVAAMLTALTLRWQQ